jgi:hypothetical protein
VQEVKNSMTSSKSRRFSAHKLREAEQPTFIMNSKHLRILLILLVSMMMACAVNSRLIGTTTIPDENENTGSINLVSPDEATEGNDSTVDVTTTRKVQQNMTRTKVWEGKNGDLCVRTNREVVEGRKHRCVECKAKRGTMWKDGLLRCGKQKQTPQQVWQGKDGDLCTHNNGSVVTGQRELCSKCKSKEGTVWNDKRLRCGRQYQSGQSEWKGNDGDLCAKITSQIDVGRVELCSKCKAKFGTVWKDGQLRCSSENYVKPGTKDCLGTGVFIPYSDQENCCNGAVCGILNGCRCK